MLLISKSYFKQSLVRYRACASVTAPLQLRNKQTSDEASSDFFACRVMMPKWRGGLVIACDSLIGQLHFVWQVSLREGLVDNVLLTCVLVGRHMLAYSNSQLVVTSTRVWMT